MKLLDSLHSCTVHFSAATERDAAIWELSGTLASVAGMTPAELAQAMLDRERLCTTGIGFGVAVPHVRDARVRGLNLAVAVLRAPVAFNSLDGAPVGLIFMFAGDPTSHRDYLRALSAVTQRCRSATWRAAMLAAPDAETVLQLLDTGGTPDPGSTT